MSPDATIAALQTALAAEHAAIYGYGLLGPRLRGTQAQSAKVFWDAHRTMRDRLRALIVEQQAQPVAAAAAYALPVKVTSAASAVQLAATIEDTLVTAYLGVAGADEGSTRRFAAVAMQDAVGRAIRWRGSGPDSAFPGMSEAALSPSPEP